MRLRLGLDPTAAVLRYQMALHLGCSRESVRLLRHTAFSRGDRTSRWTPTAGGWVPT